MTEPNDKDPSQWPVLVEYGETGNGKDGCSIRVQLVQTPRGAHRVRMQLRRDDREIKRIDITGATAAKLLPLLALTVPTSKEGG